MLARPFMAFLKPELTAHALQLIEGGAIDVISGLKAERIDSRPAAQVRPLLARLIPGSECRGRRDEGDAAVGCVEISGRACFGEIPPRARMHDVRVLQMFDIR